jgi:O-antigen ligase
MPNLAATHTGARHKPPLQAGLLLAALLFALFSGLVAVFLPAWFVVSVLVMPSVLVVLIFRPEYALVACIAFAGKLVHPALEPRVPFLGGSLAAADATLLVLVGYAVWVHAHRAGKVRRASSARLPLTGGGLLAATAVLFGVSLLFSIVLSLSMKGLRASVVLGEARDLLFLLLLPVALVILRERQRQERFVIALVVLACLFSIGQLLQGLFSVQVFGTSGISALETLGYREYSTTRSNTHGLSVIIFALFLTIGAHALGVLRRGLFVPLFSLLVMGILLTFGRTTFATVVVCVLVLVAWLNLKALPRLAALSTLFLLLVGTLGYALKPASFDAVIYRMTSVSDELRYGHSAGWRYQEADAMLPHIADYPLTGLGLGADYKGVSGSSAHPDLNRYMHNAYLYMAGKMGVPALLLFLLMMVAILVIGRRLAKSDAPPWARVVGAASAVMMFRFWIASITEPHLMSDHGVATIAVCGALVVLAARRTSDAAPQAARPAMPDRRAALSRPAAPAGLGARGRAR